MKKYLYILSLLFTCSCSPKDKTTSKSADSITEVTAASSPVVEVKEEISLPESPDWISKNEDIQYSIERWNNKAKYELYTFDEFCNTIPSMVNSLSADSKNIVEPIKTERQYTSLHKIISDSALYVFASVSYPEGSLFFYCWHQFSRKDNIYLFEESSPIKFVDYSDPSIEWDIQLDKLFFAENGDLCFSISISGDWGESGSDDEGPNFVYGSCKNLEFFDKTGLQLFWTEIGFWSSVRNNENEYKHGRESNGTLEISREEFYNGFPIITKQTNNITRGKDEETEKDTTYTTIYKYDIVSKKYQQEEF